MSQPSIRRIIQTVTGTPTTDGAGVRLTRLLGSGQLLQLDPFLLLDEFRSDSPDDYIGGFPSHPHRGFETITYMKAGTFQHKDSTGNEAIIDAGGVQWMTAGRGIIHSEMLRYFVRLSTSTRTAHVILNKITRSATKSKDISGGASLSMT